MVVSSSDIHQLELQVRYTELVEGVAYGGEAMKEFIAATVRQQQGL